MKLIGAAIRVLRLLVEGNASAQQLVIFLPNAAQFVTHIQQGPDGDVIEMLLETDRVQFREFGPGNSM